MSFPDMVVRTVNRPLQLSEATLGPIGANPVVDMFANCVLTKTQCFGSSGQTAGSTPLRNRFP
jgi:hypothetical protein